MLTENQSSNTEGVSELLPCPFCKAAMRIESNRDWHRVMGGHDDECVFMDSETMMVPATDEQRELLVRHWNRRKQPAAQHQGKPLASVPDGYCIMPNRLTAENGAKALLLGEFKLEVTRECPECLELEEPLEGCEICDGEGEYGQRHTIPWDQIKFIYSEAVKGLALRPQATTDRKS